MEVGRLAVVGVVGACGPAADQPDHDGRVVELTAPEREALYLCGDCKGCDEVPLVLLLADEVRLLRQGLREAPQVGLDLHPEAPRSPELARHDLLHLVVVEVVEDAVRGGDHEVPGAHADPDEVGQVDRRVAAAQLVGAVEIVRLIARPVDHAGEDQRLVGVGRHALRGAQDHRPRVAEVQDRQRVAIELPQQTRGPALQADPAKLLERLPEGALEVRPGVPDLADVRVGQPEQVSGELSGVDPVPLPAADAVGDAE
mmetsp:Transcript_76522/g.216348  ORF Transcript_76522/g.216348 Transcript_76522/m.216348 type:complete len:257 (-) Transcript_76522:204-974(-)